jgi:hypothetical protein
MILDRLAKIQRELKAPKGQFNAFGKYKYRSCEDILEAVKPLLDGAILVINDELLLIGNRFYVKATATLRDDTATIEATAYAREEETKKGMDASQITGAASSYARKYALNGLFLIDDTKDADTQAPEKEKPVKAKVDDIPTPEPPVSANVGNEPADEKQATVLQVQRIQILMKERGITKRDSILDELSAFCGRQIKSSKELSFDEADEWIKANITPDEAA